MRRLALTALIISLCLPLQAAAQQQETLADIRQELTVLYVDIQRLKRELSTTGAPQGTVSGGSSLARIDAIEAQLQRLTGFTEKLENRINRIVQDGTNRIGDLEFRLVELEGGDVSQLGETSTLGGGVRPTGTSGPTPVPTTELAVGEAADFDRAKVALDQGDFAEAVDQFTAFVATYPGSPLQSEAHLRRGMALEGNSELTSAARAYLESYSSNPTGPVAAEALFYLGRSIGKLGQVNEACVTLGEVEIRHAGSVMVPKAQEEMQSLGCQ